MTHSPVRSDAAFTWKVHPDGAFDLIAPGIRLRRCYPALDHEPLRPVSVSVEKISGGTEISYALTAGNLRLRLEKADGGLCLRTTLEGFAEAPHWLHPLSGGMIETTDGTRPRFFRTGLGFSGPTGFVDLSDRKGPWAFDSYLVTGFVHGTGEDTLVAGAFEHSRFLQSCHVENRHYTRQFRNRETAWDVPWFEAGFAMERIPLGGASTELPILQFSAGRGAFATLRAFAGRMAEAIGARRRFPPLYHYCSWYERTRLYTLADLQRLARGFRAQGIPIQSMQIDDGWEPNLGDWMEATERWPGGLEKAFQSIREMGFRPGIWVGPFMVGEESRLYREHPDWVLRGRDGQPLKEWQRDVLDGTTPAMNHACYRLDTSHPEAMAYFRNVFRQLRAWGAEFFKTDFMEWGWRDSTEVLRHTPGKTSAMYFDDSLRAVREAIGEEACWLGCITYFPPSIGYVDSIRVSSDAHPPWPKVDDLDPDKLHGGVPNAINETFTCLYFNHLFWQNDPDVTYVRDRHNSLTPMEVETHAYFYGISGVSVNTSCPVPEISEERRRLFRFLQPQDEPWTATPPYFAQDRDALVLVRRYAQEESWAVLAINPRARAVVDAFPVNELCGLERVPAFRWSFRGSEPLGEKAELVTRLSGHGHALFYLSPDGSPPPANLTLGGRYID